MMLKLYSSNNLNQKQIKHCSVQTDTFQFISDSNPKNTIYFIITYTMLPHLNLKAGLLRVLEYFYTVAFPYKDNLTTLQG